MEVYKFGGASVKDAAAVRNVAGILRSEITDTTCVVVSAMGKTTNALEVVLDAFYQGKPDATQTVKAVVESHLQILHGLFPDPAHEAYAKVKALFTDLMREARSLGKTPYDEAYDRIVSYGERLSTCIIAEYLNDQGIGTAELDARNLVITDGHFREGKVLWEPTAERIRKAAEQVKEDGLLVALTQGFIARSEEGKTVTLGREGSDYSAAIFSYCLDAEKMTIWKDVPGVLNADPKYFTHTRKLDYISYYDATELAYYGASIIHPKTIKPLQNKHIPLHVRSFMDVAAPGTWVGLDDVPNSEIPSFICKPKQVLLSIYPKDFSFIDESNLSEIFGILVKNGMKVNLMQNSALSFSVCLDQMRGDLDAVLSQLSPRYDCRFNQELELVTIRHHTQEVIDSIVGGREVLLEQRTRQAAQLVLKIG
ncbi:aspartate kinase [bacterium]|nr:aspartate kinase [bacterium]